MALFSIYSIQTENILALYFRIILFTFKMASCVKRDSSPINHISSYDEYNIPY